jgi:hypothetical protein
MTSKNCMPVSCPERMPDNIATHRVSVFFLMILAIPFVLFIACVEKGTHKAVNSPVAGSTGIAGSGSLSAGTQATAGASGQVSANNLGGAGGGATSSQGGIGGATSSQGGSGGATSSQGGSGATGTAGAISKASVVACPGQAAAVPDGVCKQTAPGIYALRLDIPVYWGSKTMLEGLVTVVDPGRGAFVYFAKIDTGNVCEDGKFDAKLYTCGITVPTSFSSLLCEGYQIVISESSWDRPDISPFTPKGSFTGFTPGSTFALDMIDYVFGLEMTDPSGPWPTSSQTLTVACPSGTGKACYTDYDRDGKPGVTLSINGSGGGNVADTGCTDAMGSDNPFKRNYPPLSADATALLGGAARWDEAYVAFRIKVGGGGTIDSECIKGWGEVPGEYLQVRAGGGCRVKEGTVDFLGTPAGPNTPCSDAQTSFSDAQFPEFSVMKKGEKPPANLNISDNSASVGTIASVVRLGDTNQSFSCADVRNAAFPESK